MKQVNISVSFDEDKLKALNRYMSKRDLTVDAELTDALTKLYEKHVPAAVREYIDETDVAPVQAKPKRPVKSALVKQALPLSQAEEEMVIEQ